MQMWGGYTGAASVTHCTEFGCVWAVCFGGLRGGRCALLSCVAGGVGVGACEARGVRVACGR